MNIQFSDHAFLSFQSFFVLCLYLTPQFSCQWEDRFELVNCSVEFIFLCLLFQLRTSLRGGGSCLSAVEEKPFLRLPLLRHLQSIHILARPSSTLRKPGYPSPSLLKTELSFVSTQTATFHQIFQPHYFAKKK